MPPVDRSRFLFLTASLAAAACNQPTQPGGAASPTTGGADPAATPGQAAEAAPADGSSVWLEIEPGSEASTTTLANADCDNLAGRPPPCSLSAPAGHCESFDSTVRLCRSFPEFLQPRAAEAAVNCMVAASGSQAICDWTIWNQCATAGLQATCVEPATRTECDAISSTCGGSVDTFTCQQALSAIKPHKRSQLGSCIREFCEVPFCVTDSGSF